MRFTPSALADALALEVLTTPAPGRRQEAPAVLDPACGNGELLLAAWRVGRRLGLTSDRLHGIEIDPELAEEARRRLRHGIGGTVGEAAARNVRVADALDPRTRWPAGTCVVANPPWLSYSGRQSGRRQGGDDAPPVGAAGGWPSAHGAFLARIAGHVASERLPAGALVPASVADLAGYGPVRAAVTTGARLARAPLELGESAFPGVVEPAISVLLAPRPRPGTGQEAPWTRPGPEESRLLRALDGLPRLPAACFGDPGVHTGNAARDLIRPLNDAQRPPIREGRDAEAYRIGPPRLALDTELTRTAERRFRYAPWERYAAIPIVVRQTADRPIAALHEPPAYFRNTLLACTSPAELDAGFVVGVLNSPIVAGWHRLSFRDARQRTFPQVKVAHLRAAPFPMADRAEAAGVHDDVAQAVRTLAARPDLADELVPAIEARVAEAFGLAPDVAAELTRRGRR